MWAMRVKGRGRRGRLLGIAVFAMGLIAITFAPVTLAQLAGFAPAEVTPLLPLPPRVSPVPVPAHLNTQRRAERLRKHALHQKNFWVRDVLGDVSATKTVIVVPQFHRSATHPIAWSSLGAAIADVQLNIEVLISVLARTQATTCVGTEGSAAPRILASHELRRLAWWRQDLLAAEAAVKRVLAGEEREVDDELETLRVVLEGALKDRAAILDGVGAFQARSHESDHEERTLLDRFGLEDPAVNARAVALVRERDDLYRDLARLETSALSEVQGALEQMWLDEYPLYRESTVGPLQETLALLDQERLALMRADATFVARELGRYLALVRRIADDTIKPDEVEATFAYYQEVGTRLGDGGAPADNKALRAPLSRKERRQKRRLEKKLAKLEQRYQKVAHGERDRIAALRVLERVNAPEHRACVLVFGQGHRAGVMEALLSLAQGTGLGPIGVIVVEPFDL